MTQQVFVARERELAYLQTFLTRALEGQGQVVFVAGEAGSGKTALLREFARLAQDVRADLVVAVGECNAQTGIGDPYLPFCEVLRMLSGDVDAKLARGATTQENANRLRALLQTSGQALVEVGPTLINTLVPGTLVITMAAKFLAKQAGWLKPLEKLNERKSAPPSEGGQDQSHIFEQYTNVLKVIAAKQPLILVVDDLQWADAGSISLLFHLSRRISQSHILLVGAYRPDEIALGRGGERHPLDKVLAECKRYMGDIVLDLDQAAESENRQFVDAFLDAEPNCFGNGFHEALYHRTGGHALFTVELLRTMQERGDLQRDGQGRWIENRTLDWTTLPARVEGVIEERIGRLEKELREILRAASVEGQDFTAQVVARVQEIRERQLLRDLSEELDKRHHLVREQGETRVGSQVLSRYQFSHALFQRYLYNDLSAGERRLLHGEVARVLEELYAGCTDTIVVQLAHHYAKAGNAEKASSYLLKAGDAATDSYAYPEARIHYAQAREMLALVPDSAESRRQRVDVIVRFLTVSINAAVPTFRLQLCDEAEAIIQSLLGSSVASDSDPTSHSDWLRLAQIYRSKAGAYWRCNELHSAIATVGKGIALAKTLGDENHEKIATATLGYVLTNQGQFREAEHLMKQACEYCEKANLWGTWALNTAWLGICFAMQGKLVEGQTAMRNSLARAEKMGFEMAIAGAHLALAESFRIIGDASSMSQNSQAAVHAAEKSEDRLFVHLGYVFQALAQSMLGNHAEALDTLSHGKEVFPGSERHLLLSDWIFAFEAEIALNAGRFQDAVNLADGATRHAEPIGGIFAQGFAHRVWGQALNAIKPTEWDEIESHMATSFQSFAAGQAHVDAARTQVVWGNLCRERGNLQAARQHFEQAVAILEQTDLTAELEKTRGLLDAQELRT